MAEELDKKYCVYAHVKKGTNYVFYIGRGLNDRARRTTSRNRWWVNTVNKYGFDYFKIEESLTFDESKNLEVYWIAQFREWGFNLVNLTSGGDGVVGYKRDMEQYNKTIRPYIANRVQSKEERNRRSLSARETYKNNPSIKSKISKTMRLRNTHCVAIYQYDTYNNLLNKYPSIANASISLGISRTAINNQLKGYTRTSGGYVFKYS